MINDEDHLEGNRGYFWIQSGGRETKEISGSEKVGPLRRKSHIFLDPKWRPVNQRDFWVRKVTLSIAQTFSVCFFLFPCCWQTAERWVPYGGAEEGEKKGRKLKRQEPVFSEH